MKKFLCRDLVKPIGNRAVAGEEAAQKGRLYVLQVGQQGAHGHLSHDDGIVALLV